MPKKTSKKVANPGFVPMPVVNPNSAGIDIGDTIHVVAVPKDRDQQAVRVFGTMRCDLK